MKTERTFFYVGLSGKNDKPLFQGVLPARDAFQAISLATDRCDSATSIISVQALPVQTLTFSEKDWRALKKKRRLQHIQNLNESED